MGKGSKKLYWAGAGAAFLLVMLLALAVIVPWFVDSAWLKETIRTEVAKQINGELDFQKAEISILPSPSVALQQVSLAIPDAVNAKLDTLKVYPRLIPLLTGNIQLNEVVIINPDYSMPFPQRKDEEPKDEEEFSLNEFLEATSEELTPVLSAVAGLEVGIRNGTLRLLDGDKEVYLFDNINTDLNATSESLTISMSSGSNIWESLEMKVKFTPGSKEGKGKVSLDGINGKVLADYLLTDKAPLAGGSISSLLVNFTINPKDGLTADIKSSGASFTAGHKNEKVTAKIDNLKGSIQHNDNLSTVTIDELLLTNPQVELSGSFTLDNTVPYASLDIKTQNSDITSVREVLPVFIAALFGDLPIVQEIFNITRDGIVTGAGFHVEGKSLADLAVFESMLIQGHVEEGKIVLADLGLDLHEVTGDVIIADGILEGKNLQAKLGNTTGSDGSLTLGLVKKETTPFHLDLALNADMEDVVPALKRMLPNENIQRYLALFESYGGTSQARLTLGESLESPSIRAVIDKINYRAKLMHVPYLIAIDRGRIVYDGFTTESHDLQGKIGNSTFTNYSSRINFEDVPLVEVQSGTFHLVLDEIFPWLTSHEKLAKELVNITSISGITDITVNSIKGPFLNPAELLYDLQGTVKNIALDTTRLPGTLNIKKGRSAIIPDKITFIDLHADLLDSSLIYSGILQGFMSGKTKAEVIVTDAEIGTELNTWLVEEIKAPKQYQFRTPLLISRAHAKWTRNELFDLQGDFSIKNGPLFSVDVMLNPDEFILRNLSIQNGGDRAAIMLDMEKRKFGAGFQGTLSQRTIDEIMLYKEAFPDAWIKGDIRFHVDLDSPAASTASGHLDGGDFIIPLNHDKRILLDSYSISAKDKTIHLNTGAAVFEDHDFSLKGSAYLSQDRVSIDVNAKTGTIELNKILEALQGEEEAKEIEEEEEQRIGKTWDLTLGANLSIHADSLQYNGHTWEPFESQIIIENTYLGIEVLEAELCNISTPGKVSFHEGRLTLDFQMEAVDQEFSEVLICLEGGEQQMTGALDLKANISGYGTKETLVDSLQGDLQFSAKDGRIYQDAHAAKLLYFLNVTNMFQGKIPDLQAAGFRYDSLIVSGAMERGILTISPAKLDAPIMEIASHGTIDIPGKRVNLQVLVAPLQKLNKIQKILPIINKIIPSSLIAVPVEVYGDFSNIQVRAMSVSAISKNVFGVMVDALSTPVRVLEDTSTEAK